MGDVTRIHIPRSSRPVLVIVINKPLDKTHRLARSEIFIQANDIRGGHIAQDGKKRPDFVHILQDLEYLESIYERKMGNCQCGQW